MKEEEKERKDEGKELKEIPKKESGDKKEEPKVRDDFAPLVKSFGQSSEESLDSYQAAQARELKLVSVYLDSHSGIICKTDPRGIIHTEDSGYETDNKGRKRRRRFFMGLQTEAATKGWETKSDKLPEKKTPKAFEIRAQSDQMLKIVIEAAQDAGDRMQRKIDEENYEWFPIHLTSPETHSINEDKEPDPDNILIKELVSAAHQGVMEKLGAKVDKIEVVLLKWTEHMLYADANDSKTDQMIPRISFVISVKTKQGSECLAIIRGAMGSLKEVLTRYVPEDAPKEDRILSNVVKKLIDQIVQEAYDLDRAQGAGILGSECPVIFAPQVAGVLAHEVMGHVAEADIICENRKRKSAKITLKSRIGSQVSDYPRFNLIDTPEANLELPKRTIRNNFGAFVVDGYGNKGKQTQIVQNGIMVNALTDRHTFNEVKDGLKPEIVKGIEEHGLSGSVRREKFDCKPQIRMRGTFILPDEKGPDSLEKMAVLIPKNKKGVYVKSCHGGWVNPDGGEFQINGNLCYLIENGQVTSKPIKDVKVNGNISKFNQAIKAIGTSATMHHTFAGWCGKNDQMVPVDGAGPLVYIENATIGGGGVPHPPWKKLVKEYVKQHQEVSEGKRTSSAINIPEFADVIGPNKPQDKICLLTAALPAEEEIAIITGQRDRATHEMRGDKVVERRNRYA